jgi:hypothetical protein
MAASDIITRTAYPDAEIRGQLRQWKQRLARQYRSFDRAYCNEATLRPLIEDMIKRKSAVGRMRAFHKISQAFGPGVILEGLRLSGNYPIAVWSILKPRHSVLAEDPAETPVMQDCVTVNYVLGGVQPLAVINQKAVVNACATEGLWTLEIPDHALGRVVARARMTPTEIVMEAHHNLLMLRTDQLVRDGIIDAHRQFLVRAGPGGFVCNWVVAQDSSISKEFAAHVYASTWLADDMLNNNQILLVDDGLPGHRLRDCWLLPVPMRRIMLTDSNKAVVAVWPPGLPELLAQPRGNA